MGGHDSSGTRRGLRTEGVTWAFKRSFIDATPQRAPKKGRAATGTCRRRQAWASLKVNCHRACDHVRGSGAPFFVCTSGNRCTFFRSSLCSLLFLRPNLNKGKSRKKVARSLLFSCEKGCFLSPYCKLLFRFPKCAWPLAPAATNALERTKKRLSFSSISTPPSVRVGPIKT